LRYWTEVSRRTSRGPGVVQLSSGAEGGGVGGGPETGGVDVVFPEPPVPGLPELPAPPLELGLPGEPAPGTVLDLPPLPGAEPPTPEGADMPPEPDGPGSCDSTEPSAHATLASASSPSPTRRKPEALDAFERSVFGSSTAARAPSLARPEWIARGRSAPPEEARR
jgi:hypothetical protein